MTTKTKQEETHMAAKKSVAKATTVTEIVPLIGVALLRQNYEKLAAMNTAVQEQMQEAYKFARANMLIYSAPSVVRDEDDTEYAESWDSSDC
jgi:hypothetical protein